MGNQGARLHTKDRPGRAYNKAAPSGTSPTTQPLNPISEGPCVWSNRRSVLRLRYALFFRLGAPAPFLGAMALCFDVDPQRRRGSCLGLSPPLHSPWGLLHGQPPPEGSPCGSERTPRRTFTRKSTFAGAAAAVMLHMGARAHITHATGIYTL